MNLPSQVLFVKISKSIKIFNLQFIKRLENSYKVLLRESKPSEENKGQYYLKFLERLRYFCFDSLIVGANYSRRHVALQMLTWVEEMDMEGYGRLVFSLYLLFYIPRVANKSTAHHHHFQILDKINALKFSVTSLDLIISSLLEIFV